MYPLPGDVQHRAPERESFDDARLVDLEAEQESPFLRGQKRVSVRRASLPQKTANRLLWAGAALVALGVLGAACLGLYRYGEHSWRFRIDSSDQIEVSGAEHVAHAQIMEVMGGDIGRNIFFVPLAQRQQQLEQIPWVESASVMRFVPNRLRIEIHERTPVAFARIGAHISLIDAGGTPMELATGGKHKYSFPVIAGMNAGEALSTRLRVTRADLVAVAVYCALPLLIDLPFSLDGRPLMDGDNLYQNFPLRVLAGKLIAGGHLPAATPPRIPAIRES